MNELSRAELARDASLRKLLAEETSSDEESYFDSEDEHCIPPRLESEPSDNDNRGDANEFIEIDETDESEDNESTRCSGNKLATNQNRYVAKDGTIWSKLPINQTTPKAMKQRSSPHGLTETLSICNTFKCIFTSRMVGIIIQHTNRKARSIYQSYNEASSLMTPIAWNDLTETEFYAFLGILIASGANKSNTDNVFEMWKRNSYPLYRATMGRNRFSAIIKYIRFDGANTRAQRMEADKAAPIREIWTMLNANLSSIYTPTENLTIDEQLYPYRGRTRFARYDRSNPIDRRTKVWWICDARNRYPLTGILCNGESTTGREQKGEERVVERLATPFKGSGRNITMDSSFTTLPLAGKLLTWGLTVVGTLKPTENFVPREMKQAKDVSSLFAYKKNVTLCSYTPRKGKTVILLSSLHRDSATSGPKNEPNIVEFYNKTKPCILNRLIERYTVRRRTNRWPVNFFFNILDIAALAAYIIYLENNATLKKKIVRRRTFLRQLAEELCLPIVQERSANELIMRNSSTKLAVESILGCTSIESSNNESISLPIQRDTSRKITVGSCHVCYQAPQRKKRKTRKGCYNCKRPICDEHFKTLTVCETCATPN